ncbi:MAG: DNA ligase D [Planctomycetia bacterium]|nr:DNA ligase D [Planctomycetia bacterium]
MTTSSLDEYRRKRDFRRSPEPDAKTQKGGRARAKRKKTAAPRFVVQKHKSSRLHYDFRLEMGGVLVSWAVPKGPCLDHKRKRLAIHVEDHPLEYGKFEGVIPEGQYGAGAVMVWDTGTWSPCEGNEGLEKGMLKFALEGEKLKGRWALVKMRQRQGEKDNQWLLIKERDDQARPLAEFDVLHARPDSALSGRTIEAIADNPALVWKEGKPRRAGWGSRRRPRLHPENLPGAVREAMPRRMAPQLAVPVAAPPEGDLWLHEIKFDGYRLLCHIDDGRVTLRTRNNVDWTDRFPHLVENAQALPVRSAVLDGEVVALLPSGASSFQALQTAFQQRRERQLVYYAFDLLYLDGFSLEPCPLEERKKLLAAIVDRAGREPIQLADHIAGRGAEFFEQCFQAGLEGVVSKRRDRPHRSGRTPDWQKAKCRKQAELVVGGFTPPQGSRQGFGALVLGYFNSDGTLAYAGRVGSGFDDAALASLKSRLGSLAQPKNPFGDLPRSKIDRGTRWVQPKLVARVEFSNWTDEGILRHPTFQGLREDASAGTVTRYGLERETALPPRAPPATTLPTQAAAGSAAQAPHTRRKLSKAHLDQLSKVQLSNPKRVLYPDVGVTKLDLATYFVEIADWILPHISGRPLSIVRCPDGVQGERFFQKHGAAAVPDAVGRVPIATSEGPKQHLYVKDLAGLVSLAQISALELHVWGSRVDRLEQPDRIVFDLDPSPEVDWPDIIACAFRLRQLLAELGLTSFVKTSGSKGLHVVVPIQARSDWEEALDFSRSVSQRMARESPRQCTASMSKVARVGRIYVDFHRNHRGATTVAPYSPRALASAAVSTPVAWDELPTLTGAGQFTILNLRRRLATLPADPWAKMASLRQSIPALRKP